MKIVSKLILLILVVVIFSIISCRNDKAEVPVTNSLTSINSFFDKNGAQTQIFAMNTNSSQQITGTQGTVISFNANCFVTLSGKPVGGIVNIKLREIYDKKTMLLSNVPTNAELYPGGPKAPLFSGGEIFVGASQNGVELKLAPGQRYKVFLPSTNLNSEMKYFNGITTNNEFLWVLKNSAPEDTVTPSNFPMGYFMSCDSLQWSNCDRFLPNPNFTNVTISVSGTFNPSHINAFVWYDNFNTITPLYFFNTSTNEYFESRAPYGLGVHFIVISVKNGKLYSGIISTNIDYNAVHNLTLTETTEAAFANSLAALP